MQDERSTVFGDHAEVVPPLPLDELCSPNVVNVLPAILAVVCALVVQTHLGLVVPHVDECGLHAVAHLYLSSGGGQAVVDEQ